MNHCHKASFDLETSISNNNLIYFSVQLLVNNKIISLDLPVAEVYKKVWWTTNEVCASFFFFFFLEMWVSFSNLI
jgi:hypothetical protein